MELRKLRMKIGPHEFEAEGSDEFVEAQFQAFRELVRTAGSSAQALDSGSKEASLSNGVEAAAQDTTRFEAARKDHLNSIFGIEGKRELVTLRILPKGKNAVADAIMLLLLGHRLMKQSDEVAATEINPGLRRSGLKVQRIDRPIKNHERAGLVLSRGSGKGRKYRLTNTGVDASRRLMTEILSQVH